MNRVGWPLLFLVIVIAYCVLYAPYGINETDGGFLTGLAWQVLQGKVLYHDLVYVRPPLPVWLRALELRLLPDHYAILGERWIFYLKLATYSGLAAAILTAGRSRWLLATLGFIVSVHCYPAAAWHTVDGILLAVLAAWLLFKMPGRWAAPGAGLALFAALLCKQSFYPLAVLGVLAAGFSPQRFRAVTGMLLGMLLGSSLFFNYLYQNNLIAGFLRMTGGAASGGQAWQHGVVDYFRIQPILAVLSVWLLAPVVAWFWQQKKAKWAYAGWWCWLALLIGSYACAIWRNQDFTPPFAQARLLWGLGVGFWGYQIYQYRSARTAWPTSVPAMGLLLAISWCSAISWGYNLPILFALPGVWAAMEISRQLRTAVGIEGATAPAPVWTGLVVLALLAVNRYGYEFVYRDGRRSAMTEEMGTIFPALTGIRSDAETAALYRELRDLSTLYGPNLKTLPAFPQANFLTGTSPPLPLDWVVLREMNRDTSLVLSVLKNKKPMLLVEKRYLPALETDLELRPLRPIIRTATRIEERPHFLVLKPAD